MQSTPHGDPAQLTAGRVISRWSLLARAWVLAATPALAQPLLSDPMENASAWTVSATEGVHATLASESAAGASGQALRVEYDFKGGGGFVMLRRVVEIDLPEHYRVMARLRGEGPVNNLEMKLVDATGENVWWVNRRGYSWPADWTTLWTPKRLFSFAWGPSGGAPLAKVGSIEIVIAANTPQAQGGKGTVWIDELAIESMEAPAPLPQNWLTPERAEPGVSTLDLGGLCDLGGLTLEWGPERAASYRVELSSDGRTFAPAAMIESAAGGRDDVRLPDASAKRVRIVATDGSGAVPTRVRVLDPALGDSLNAFVRAIAQDQPRGLYPQPFLGEQRYWTVTGVAEDDAEALVAEDGTVEVGKGRFSIEPRVEITTARGALRLDWAATEQEPGTKVELQYGYAPMPVVTRQAAGIDMQVMPVAVGGPGSSVLALLYAVKNTSPVAVEGELRLALRPFQVLTPWQELNLTGGVSPISTVRLAQGELTLEQPAGTTRVIPLAPAAGGAWRVLASPFAEGKAASANRPLVPIDAEKSEGVAELRDPAGLPHIELVSPGFSLQPGTDASFVVIVPLHAETLGFTSSTRGDDPRLLSLIAEQASYWMRELNKVVLQLPLSQQTLVETFKAQQGYILVNQDGPRIQPGSRTYERSWIRDGSLTGTALLATGHAPRVRASLEWYAPFQFESGKVPCVVDARGADPTDEHDSHGQLIYALWKYYRFSRDRAFLAEHFPHVRRAVAFIDAMRASRSTPMYAQGQDLTRAKFGLMPESISHEGYSAKPMHSYWDDLFVLKGLKDAVRIAEELGEEEQAAAFAASRDAFAAALYESVRRTVAHHGIDYMPGCVELGDFDPTSTTVAIFPCGELGRFEEQLPGLLPRTFERWWTFFTQRRDGTKPSTEYTPYELRSVGSWVYLDRRDRAHEALEFYFKDQRPAAWRHWAEVVWREPLNPRFIGDMPHTWVGSDFVNAVRAMFVYERESDQSLVLAAGVRSNWMKEAGENNQAVAIGGWPTEYGVISYAATTGTGDSSAWLIELKGEVPPGGLVLAWPEPGVKFSATVNGAEAELVQGRVVIRQPRAVVEFTIEP